MLSNGVEVKYFLRSIMTSPWKFLAVSNTWHGFPPVMRALYLIRQLLILTNMCVPFTETCISFCQLYRCFMWVELCYCFQSESALQYFLESWKLEHRKEAFRLDQDLIIQVLWAKCTVSSEIMASYLTPEILV